MSKKIYKYRKLDANIPSTGIECLDKHHNKFVILINNLVDILNDVQNETDLLSIFHKLLYYAEIYFIAEEIYYQQNNYSNFINHKQEHIQFTETIFNLQSEYQSGSDISEKMMKFLDRWYKNHILQADINAVKKVKR